MEQGSIFNICFVDVAVTSFQALPWISPLSTRKPQPTPILSTRDYEANSLPTGLSLKFGPTDKAGAVYRVTISIMQRNPS